jgi:hypothetical protein
MSDDLHLFNPDLYGQGRKQRTKGVRTDPPVEALVEPWTFMRNRHGVMSRTHVVANTGGNGASYTLCGKLGTVMSDPGVAVMRRCRDCNVELQSQ